MSEKARKRVLLFLQGFLLLGLFSCISQEPRNLRKTRYYAKKQPVGKPQYGTQTQNYFQEGNNTSSTRMILQDNLLDGFYMRGKEVHDYILKSQNTTQCMAVLFKAQDNNAIDNFDRNLILAAFPQSFLNFPIIPESGITFLKSQNLQITLIFVVQGLQLIRDSSKSYSFQDLSSNYKGSLILGNTIQMLETNGTKITAISSKHLSLQINKTSSAENPLTKTCTESSFCQSLGFDCCSGGTCVKDGQKKTGNFESEPEYLQSVQDILANASNYKLYPQYYYICTEKPVDYGSGGGTGSTLDPYDEKEKRLLMLKELYDLYYPL